MSELKAYKGDIYIPVYGSIADAKVYLKSEADKVIANRDYEIKKLKDTIGKLLKAKTEQIIDEVMQKALIYGDGFVRVEDMMKLIAELHHQKYKRCFAMAEWCKARYDEEDARINGHGASWDYISLKMKYWERWQWRWEELAEKFKPNKSTAQ